MGAEWALGKFTKLLIKGFHFIPFFWDLKRNKEVLGNKAERALAAITNLL